MLKKEESRKSIFILTICVSLIIFLCSINTAYAISEQWSETFGGKNNDRATHIQQTQDSGYIITGIYQTKSGLLSTDDNAWLIKINSKGKKEWSKTFGGEKGDRAKYVQQTQDGGYIIVGETSSYGNGQSDIWLIKTDANGKQKWDKTFGNMGGESAESVEQTSDGGYIITGYGNIYEDNQVKSGAWLIKTDASGNKQWDKRFTNHPGMLYIDQTSDAGYIIIGQHQPFGDLFVTKTDERGNKTWSINYQSQQFPLYTVQQTLDGGYVVAGAKIIENMKNDAWIIKLNSNGDEQWNKTYGENKDDFIYFVQQTYDGGYIAAGSMIPALNSKNQKFAWIFKTDANGNKQWEKLFGENTEDDYFTYVQETSNGGYIALGTTSSYGKGGTDLFVVKLGDKSIDSTSSEKSTPGFSLFMGLSVFVIFFFSKKIKG